MVRKHFHLRALARICICIATAVAARAQDIDVKATLQMAPAGGQVSSARSVTAKAAVWLKPIAADAPLPPAGRFRMAQKNKSFQPHFLVVPIGSIVSFPNLDLFFHNVFSQFNGKRFDLGLYETGSTRDVHFDHEGVSYIFCNIHPEMSAVIVTVSTPWYAVVADDDSVLLHNVPPGDYELHVWAEGADPKQLAALTHRVHIEIGHEYLGVIRVATNNAVPSHKNKFGDDYRTDASSPY